MIFLALTLNIVSINVKFKKTKLRFLDTMCMHIACSGFTSEQRILSNKFGSKEIDTSETSKIIEATNWSFKERGKNAQPVTFELRILS